MYKTLSGLNTTNSLPERGLGVLVSGLGELMDI